MCAVLCSALLSRAQIGEPARGTEQDQSTYVLGPGDQLSVSALDVEELGKEPYRIGLDGTLTLPFAGSIRANGLTVEEMTDTIRVRLSKYVKDPDVTVNLLEMRSQPVSVLGEVRNPGVRYAADGTEKSYSKSYESGWGFEPGRFEM